MNVHNSQDAIATKFVKYKESHERRDSVWTEVSAVTGKPPYSSSLTTSLVTLLAYSSAPLASLFALEHVEQAASSGP